MKRFSNLASKKTNNTSNVHRVHRNGASTMITTTYLRKYVKNCNATIATCTDTETVQRATLQRESAFTAIRLIQESKRSGADVSAQVLTLCTNAGIATRKTSGKDASTWDAGEFRTIARGRFGDSYLSRIADKQASGAEHGDVAVIRNLGNQYGRTVNPPREKVKQVTPSSFPHAHKDREDKHHGRNKQGKLIEYASRVIGEVPEARTAEVMPVETMLARAEALKRGAVSLEAEASRTEDREARGKLMKRAKAAITRARNLRRLAITAQQAQQAERTRKQAEADADATRSTLVVAEHAERTRSTADASSYPKHVLAAIGKR